MLGTLPFVVHYITEEREINKGECLKSRDFILLGKVLISVQNKKNLELISRRKTFKLTRQKFRKYARMIKN